MVQLLTCDKIKNILNICVIVLALFYVLYIKESNISVALLVFNILSCVFVILEVGLKVYKVVNKLDDLDGDIQLGRNYRRKYSNKNLGLHILQIILQSFASVVGTHIIAILFGAHFISYFTETLTFSFLFASLAFIRPLIKSGPSAPLDLVGEWKWENRNQFQAAALLAGAWLGAIPIPLDWDRPWQVWPITCCVGTLLGELVASSF